VKRGLKRGLGLDFGTTNSSLAIATGGGPASLSEFASASGPTPSFRSVLFFGREERDSPVETLAGPPGIDRYLESEGERRLMQSLKSFLASSLFQATNVFGRNTGLEELIGRMLRDLAERCAADGFSPDDPVVVGRPVRFAKAKNSEDDAFAIERLTSALRLAGFERVSFEFEPVAAAYHYEQGLERDELLLIADFGGGTSDFCLLRVGPGVRERRSAADILGTEGVAIAGDCFDASIIRHVVAPRLGRGSHYKNLFSEESMPVPSSLYSDLERWHHLSFLNSRKTLSFLHDVLRGASDPEKIEALIHVVRGELGFPLYRSVQRTKLELSAGEESRFRFEDEPVYIEARVTRAEFESWIADDVAEIAACVDRLLEKTGVAERQVDRVFMTGGSSFVPAVRREFSQRFGEERIRTGGELISVASGLALRALDAFPT
jgi:hypothetical chaperone protein